MTMPLEMGDATRIVPCVALDEALRRAMRTREYADPTLIATARAVGRAAGAVARPIDDVLADVQALVTRVVSSSTSVASVSEAVFVHVWRSVRRGYDAAWPGPRMRRPAHA
jgi:hypothetical protein